MTRNMIFGSAIAGIATLMVIASLFSDEASYRDDERGIHVNVDIDIDDEEIVITSDGGRTVVYTKDGKQTCKDGDDALIITREDGSQTRIEC